MSTHYFELSANSIISDINPIVNNPASDPSSNAVVTRAFSLSSPQMYIQLGGGTGQSISTTSSIYTCIGVTNEPITVPSEWTDSSWNLIVDAQTRVATVGNGSSSGILLGSIAYSLSKPSIGSSATLSVTSGFLSDVSGVMVENNSMTLLINQSTSTIGARVPFLGSINSSFSPSKPRSVPLESGLPYYISIWATRQFGSFLGAASSTQPAAIKTTLFLEK